MQGFLLLFACRHRGLPGFIFVEAYNINIILNALDVVVSCVPRLGRGTPEGASGGSAPLVVGNQEADKCLGSVPGGLEFRTYSLRSDLRIQS